MIKFLQSLKARWHNNIGWTLVKNAFYGASLILDVASFVLVLAPPYIAVRLYYSTKVLATGLNMLLSYIKFHDVLGDRAYEQIMQDNQNLAIGAPPPLSGGAPKKYTFLE